jgi:hypothetical protein
MTVPTATARWLVRPGIVVALIACCVAPARAAASECGTYSGTGCAPDSRRVDLGTPSFSNPTRVVNPLFPISDRAWRQQNATTQPPLIAARLRGALATLGRAVRRHQARRALQASINSAQSVLDLQLRHRPRGAVGRDRLELWCHQLRIDAAAHERAAVSGDAATLGWIRDRIADTLAPEELRAVDSRLGAVQAAADTHRLDSAADHAARLVGILRASPRL